MGRVSVLVLTGLLVLGVTGAAAQERRLEAVRAELNYPQGAEAREAALLSAQTPQARAWLMAEGLREAKSEPSEAGARQAVSDRFPGLQSGDIEAMAFIVMMEAAKSADDDLKAVMAETQRINASKAALRQSMQSARPGSGGVQDRGKPDSMNELGDTESLRLQMAMDRRSKFETALSNITKKMDDTDSSITRNLK